jgi:polyphosphate glucokinase
MRKVIDHMRALVTYDRLYIGGGNARKIKKSLPKGVIIAPNEAGITGGVRLWDRRMDSMFANHAAFE